MKTPCCKTISALFFCVTGQPLALGECNKIVYRAVCLWETTFEQIAMNTFLSTPSCYRTCDKSGPSIMGLVAVFNINQRNKHNNMCTTTARAERIDGSVKLHTKTRLIYSKSLLNISDPL